MKLPFLFKNSSSSWQWPSCHQQPRTSSFRVNLQDINKICNTQNAPYLEIAESPTPESWFTKTSESTSSSTTEESTTSELLLKGLRSSDRLLVEVKGETSSILEGFRNIDNKNDDTQEGLIKFQVSTDLLTMESQDPYVDFRKSMEEMVGAHEGLKDSWENLEELLVWYLRVNGKSSYGYIISAFVDLLVSISSTSGSCGVCSNFESPSTPLSLCTCCSCSWYDESSSPMVCVSSLQADVEEGVSDYDGDCLFSLMKIEDERMSSCSSSHDVSCNI